MAIATRRCCCWIASGHKIDNKNGKKHLPEISHFVEGKRNDLIDKIIYMVHGLVFQLRKQKRVFFTNRKKSVPDISTKTTNTHMARRKKGREFRWPAGVCEAADLKETSAISVSSK
jgi:hypothetical protein